MTDTKTPLTREERLAARLRENLKRRKAQARAQGANAQNDGESLPDSANLPETGLPKSAL